MVIILVILFILVITVMVISFTTLWATTSWKTRFLSIDHLLTFLLLYTTIFVGFALIYMILEYMGIEVIGEFYSIEEDGFYDTFITNLYFSAMTLFSVGYGDVVPLGFGKIIVIIEALIGYTLPAAFVVRSVLESERR